ncbi:methyltransferase domain-containing protein [Synechococcus sp. UW105]|uniref:methyltransferase domain-containing protein n=1 Tax=Synechococcus sp. UW105 TaxID=337067 RepID=UPI0014828CEF|nr:methyltransferase domain-containing protein [Synechococcus sp. UW105]
MNSSFGAAVSTYDAAATPQRLAADRLVEEAWRLLASDSSAGPVKAPDCLLDLGCGTGLATRAWLDLLQDQGQLPPRQLLLLDQAPEMVAHAMALLSERHGAVQGLSVDAFSSDLVRVLAETPVADGMRLILSSYALQWSEAPLTVLREVWARLLQPGDWLALVVPDARSLALLRRALSAASLPNHLIELPAEQDLIGPAAQRCLDSRFIWVGCGSFANAVAVDSALAYLRHFALIGARPPSSRYSRSQLVRLRRVLDQQLREGPAVLDYHSTWMVLRRR